MSGDVYNTEWTKGRQMTGYDGVTFGYNGQGQRISKTKAGTVKYLYDVNGNLVKESGKGVEYYYDGSGVIGMKYNGGVYFYRKDVFGNITEIIDSNGNIVVRYRYDGWGNHKVARRKQKRKRYVYREYQSVPVPRVLL